MTPKTNDLKALYVDAMSNKSDKIGKKQGKVRGMTHMCYVIYTLLYILAHDIASVVLYDSDSLQYQCCGHNLNLVY